MNNLSPLFYKHTHHDRFLNNISVSDEQDQMLLEARKKIRAAIRAAFTDARKYLKERDDINELDQEIISKIVPKFMTQGSYMYKTLNAPCHPSQEIDLDDGVYLPMVILQGEPKLSKEWFFTIVDGALKELAKTEGWETCTDKDTCCRVILKGKQAHIDIPLYAVPNKRHEEMAAATFATTLSLENLLGEYLEAREFMFDPEQVYLATRNNGWNRSDPLQIARWFQQQVRKKGERLRRACRFLKAWRDYVWESGGPSSITLMVLADAAYPDDDDQKRDDYVLLKIAETLPERFRGIVKNPVDDKEAPLYPRGDIDQEEIARHAEALLDALQQAIAGAQSKETAVGKMRETYSGRFPDKPEWVITIGTADMIRNTKPQKVKADPLQNMRSG